MDHAATAAVTYRLTPSSNAEITAEALNLRNSKNDDIQYVYASRLPGEVPGGVTDRHVQPLEPRSMRVSVKVLY